MRYNITDQGIVNAYGDGEWMNREVNGTEPFDMYNYADWKQNMATGEWKLIAIDYKYIIIPNEMIPALTSDILLVEDICFDKSFDYVLQKLTIETRAGSVGDVDVLTVKMTPCKIISWEAGDDAKLQAIISAFNSKYNPPRLIQCVCYFANINALEAFIAAQG